LEAGPRWQNLGIGGGSAFEARRASAGSSGHSSMEGVRERSDPLSLTGARGRANPASAAAPRCPSPSPQGRQRKWALPARGRQRRMLGGADPGTLDRGPEGWVFARVRRTHPKGRCEGDVKLDDRSSRGVVKRLTTRVARRGFVSDGRAAPRKRGRAPRASNDSAGCTCLCESVAEVEVEHLPRTVRGHRGSKAKALDHGAQKTRGSTQRALVIVGWRRVTRSG